MINEKQVIYIKFENMLSNSFRYSLVYTQEIMAKKKIMEMISAKLRTVVTSRESGWGLGSGNVIVCILDILS